MRRLPPLALLALSFSATASQDQFKGFPETGELDAQSVITARYGNAAPNATVEPEGRGAPVAAHDKATAPRVTGGAAGVPHGFHGLTGVAVDSLGDAAQQQVPLTFGQVFAPGDLKPSERLVGQLADGDKVPLQVDVKARHADGSVRHAIVSAVLPALKAHGSLLLSLAKDGKPAAPDAAGGNADPKALLDQGFRACVTATIDGQPWSACADKLLAGKGVTPWLAGAVSREWLVAAPLRNDKGAEHPQLAARFAVRWYPAAHKARVDVAVENDWAYAENPRNIVYDAKVTVDGKQVYAKPGLKHLHHARWRKVVWWGGAPEVALRYDSAYLDATRAVPHYDPSVVVAGSALGELASRMNAKAVEPMAAGMATTYMPMTGGRNDIGLLPSWSAMYLISMAPQAALATFGTGDLAGSWPIHYRDQRTGRPVSLLDHPYMTLVGHPGDTWNPATNKQEKFPDCAPHACDSDYTPDIPHQPNLVYLPYLLSGDHYYLEELQFWASYDAFSSNPNYRDNLKGLLKSEQIRGQAWALRTLGEAAYITPDDDRLKAYFTSVVKHNLDWYNAEYTDNPAANKLGALVNGYAMVYDNGTALGPWQDDFFTSSVGHLVDLGFKDAGRLLAWKSRFPIGRMLAPGVCWIDGASYELKVRPAGDAPFFTTFAEAYKASHTPEFLALPCAGPEMAANLKLRTGSMANLPDATMGYPSNMQPALAYAADAAGATGVQGKQAWKLFMSRSVKPDYGIAPQFAIVPRSVKTASKTASKDE